MRRPLLFIIAPLTLALGLLTFDAQDAHAGCKLNLTIKNTTGSTIEVGKHRVKVKGGTWAKIVTQKETLRDGESVLHTWNATFKCSARRRYEFTYRIRNSENPGNLYTARYYPDASGWTTQQSFTWEIK